MEVTIVKTSVEKVNLTKRQCKDVAIEYMRSLLLPGQFLRIDKASGRAFVMADEDHYHGSIGEIEIRDASDRDLIIWAALQLLIHGAE